MAIRKYFPVLVLTTLTIVVAIAFARDFLPNRTAVLSIENRRQTVQVENGAASIVVSFVVKSNSMPATVTHVDANCDCAVFNNLPVEVPVGGTNRVKAEVDLSKIALPAVRQFRFYTNPPPATPLVAEVELTSVAD